MLCDKVWTRPAFAIDTGTSDESSDAGYAVSGTETRCCYVTVEEGGKIEVEAGVNISECASST